MTRKGSEVRVLYGPLQSRWSGRDLISLVVVDRIACQRFVNGAIVSNNFVEQPEFVARMKPTVDALNNLCATIETASERNGHWPAVSTRSRAMDEIEEEGQLRLASGSQWQDPVRAAHSIGGMTMAAATDYGRSYAQLFCGMRAPVFGHLVLVRAALESSVVTFWLSDGQISAEERARRGLSEELSSAWEVWRLGPPFRERGNEALRRIQGIARAMGWSITDPRGDPWTKRSRARPSIQGTARPGSAQGIADLILGTGGGGIGKVLWSQLSATMHATNYSLMQSIVEAPSGPEIRPTVAKIGTESNSVGVQSLCVLRAIRIAGEARLKLMGWMDGEWNRAALAAEQHERALVFGLRQSYSLAQEAG